MGQIEKTMRTLRRISLMLAVAYSLPAIAEDGVVTGHVELVAPDGGIPKSGLSNTAVWLTPQGGAGGARSEGGSRQTPRLVQKNKAFEPRIVILRAGAVVEFPNHDPFFHNVFSIWGSTKRVVRGRFVSTGSASVISSATSIRR
jgi:plastocyanin